MAIILNINCFIIFATTDKDELVMSPLLWLHFLKQEALEHRPSAQISKGPWRILSPIFHLTDEKEAAMHYVTCSKTWRSRAKTPVSWLQYTNRCQQATG